MANILKILGQVAPSATTETTLYTVPAQKETTASTISVNNRGASAATYRISVSAYSAATANKDYVAYDDTVGANSSISFTLGMTLQSSAIIRVYASTANFLLGGM